MEYIDALLIQTGIHILLGLSVYTVALTGQISFGQQGFLAVGAYVSAIATTLWDVPLIPALLLGTAVAAFMGFLFLSIYRNFIFVAKILTCQSSLYYSIVVAR